MQTYASILRDLHLQASRESSDFVLTDYTDICAQPPVHWQDLIKKHNGLIQVAFGIEPSLLPAIWATAPEALQYDVIMDVGIPVAMATNFGPVLRIQAPSVPSPESHANVGDGRELQFHAGPLFHIAKMRGTSQDSLFHHLSADRDEWILEHLRSAVSQVGLKARLRVSMKRNAYEAGLGSFYSRLGWRIASKTTRRQSLMVEHGPAAVQAAEGRGEDLNEQVFVVEKTYKIVQPPAHVADQDLSLHNLKARL